MWDHIIRNGTLVTPSESFRGDIYVKDGKIRAITDGPIAGGATEVTDAAGKYVLPGFVETHVHSRDGRFGNPEKEDFFHSTMAGAIGGATTVLEMPNSNPAIYNVENFHDMVNWLGPKSHTDFGVWGLCVGDLNRDQIVPLAEAGAIAFKFFWGYGLNSKNYALVYNYSSTMKDVIPPPRDGEIYKIFQEIAKTGKVIAIHAENFDLIERLTSEVMESGDKSYAAFLRARPNAASETTIQTAIAFSKWTGARLHILHLDCKEGVGLINGAQREGYHVTGETCPHYLYLTDKDFDRVGSAMKGYPPVRRKADQEELWRGLNEGILDLVCSDHAPHTEKEKDGDLWSTPAGTASIELVGPLMINAVNEGKLSLNKLCALYSENPSKLYGLYPEKGSLRIGTDADITIIDMDLEFTVSKSMLHSVSKVMPYQGFKLKGKPVQTILRGKTIAKDNEIVGAPSGRFIKK